MDIFYANLSNAILKLKMNDQTIKQKLSEHKINK